MKRMNVLAVLVVCGAAFAGAAGCHKDKKDMSGMSNNDMAMRDQMMKDMRTARGDIIDVATGPDMGRVSTLVSAIKAADLVGTLKGPGPFTVFAPTNEAFAKLPPETLAMLMKPENKEKLKSVLLYHVHSGDAIPAAMVKTMSLSTANGKPVSVVVSNGSVMVNNAKVVKTDVYATNGVIHWVDTVIMP
ncbi:hypothetical protein BH11PLA1_BH11PLA1_01760 [soil metagenome]